MTSAIFKTQLSAYIRRGRASELLEFLATLNNAHHRAASRALAEASVWVDVGDFWHFAAVLVAANSRAYLGTMLKAANALELNAPTTEFAAACSTDIDRRKVLEALLPKAISPESVNKLLQHFSLSGEQTIEILLLRTGTPAAYFVLFNRLRQHEDNPELLRRFGIELIRKGDKRSFNLASILQSYFGLAPLPGTFSLTLNPYELSRLETSYDKFRTIVNK